MEIFTDEFKELLSTQLEGLTNVVKTNNSNEMSDNEIAKAMEQCMGCLEEEPKLKKEKKKKKNQFEVGDTVYWGDSKGIVFHKDDKKLDTSLGVDFKDNYDFICYFTEDGRYLINAPRLLSHFPYKLKMKKIKK